MERRHLGRNRECKCSSSLGVFVRSLNLLFVQCCQASTAVSPTAGAALWQLGGYSLVRWTLVAAVAGAAAAFVLARECGRRQRYRQLSAAEGDGDEWTEELTLLRTAEAENRVDAK